MSTQHVSLSSSIDVLPGRFFHAKFRRLSGPYCVSHDGHMPTSYRSIQYLGNAYHRRGDQPFGLLLADRLYHTYVIGQTGTGKTTLLANLIDQDVVQGHGFCLIDPHGDLAESLASRIGAEDIYWDVANPKSPYGYNPITRTSPSHRPLVASGLIDALKKQWREAWGVRMEHLLRYAILALLEHPRADLRDIVRLYIEKKFRTEILERVADPQVQHFWQIEFPAMNYKTAIDGVAPIANKLGALLAHPVIRQAICEPEQPLRFRKLMDEGRHIIINLSKGLIGSDNADVLGGLLIASLLNAALSRHDTPETERRPFFIYADEFHSFTTLAFASMLSEVRKYGVGAILAHQYINQADPELQQAIFGNVGNLIAFRLGAADANSIARELDIEYLECLINQPNYHAFARIMVRGERTKAFSMTTYAHIT